MTATNPSDDGRDAIAAASRELRSAVTLLSRRFRRDNAFNSLAQAAVLGHLYDGGPKTTSWLAAAERVRAQSMAQVVSDLETAGLVTRHPDDVDRRQVIVTLTTLGRAALEDDRLRREEWFRRTISESLTQKECGLLLRAIPLLGRLTEP